MNVRRLKPEQPMASNWLRAARVSLKIDLIPPTSSML